MVVGSDSNPNGLGAATRLHNGASGGSSWDFRVGATGTNTPPGGFSIVDAGTGGDNNYRLAIDNTGRVGIGTTTPSEMLHVVGNILASGTVCGSNVACASSQRRKTNIQTLQGSLGKVERMRGVSFDWKENGKHDMGLIAEEVGQVVPEVVVFEENGVDARTLDYARLAAVLIEAVKEQQAQIRELRSEVDGLEARLGVEVSQKQ